LLRERVELNNKQHRRSCMRHGTFDWPEVQETETRKPDSIERQCESMITDRFHRLLIVAADEIVNTTKKARWVAARTSLSLSDLAVDAVGELLARRIVAACDGNCTVPSGERGNSKALCPIWYRKVRCVLGRYLSMQLEMDNPVRARIRTSLRRAVRTSTDVMMRHRGGTREYYRACEAKRLDGQRISSEQLLGTLPPIDARSGTGAFKNLAVTVLRSSLQVAEGSEEYSAAVSERDVLNITVKLAAGMYANAVYTEEARDQGECTVEKFESDDYITWYRGQLRAVLLEKCRWMHSAYVKTGKLEEATVDRLIQAARKYFEDIISEKASSMLSELPPDLYAEREATVLRIYKHLIRKCKETLGTRLHREAEGNVD